MSDAPSPSDLPEPSVRKLTRRIRYDAVAAVIAALVGLLALLVAGYTAYIQREQVRAQVWPYLEMGKSNADGHYEISVLNKGVGPAIVRSVQVLIAGKPVTSWDELFTRIRFKPSTGYVSSSLNQMVLSPGEQLHWISFKDAADINALTAAWQHFHVKATVCYASTLGESWVEVYQQTTPRRISRCPQLPVSEQFSD